MTAPGRAGPGLPPPPGPDEVVREVARWAGHRPWLAVVLVAAVALVVTARALLDAWRHRRHAAGARIVTIAPPPQVEASSAAALWANLAGTLAGSRSRWWCGRPHVVWQYLWSGRQLQISLWVPGTVPPGAAEAAVRAAWPGAACTTAPAAAPMPDADVVTGGHLLPSAPEWLPLRVDHDADPLRALMAAGSQLKADEVACVQVLARPAGGWRVRRAMRAAGRLRDGRGAGLDAAAPVRWLLDVVVPGPSAGRGAGGVRRDPLTDRSVRAVLDKTAFPLWQTGIRYAVAKTGGRAAAGTARRRVRGVAGAITSSYAVYTGRNALGRRRWMRRPVEVLAGRRLGGGFLTSTPELAVLAALPMDLAVPGLERARAKSMPVPVAVPSGGRNTKVLGLAEVDGHRVALPVADSRFHMHMVGGTGSGKTSLLVSMAVEEITAGRGTVVFDPHGDMVIDILDRLPESAAGRVTLFDPDQPNPPTINPLAGDDPDLVVDNLVSIFGSIFSKAWGPRMDDVMRVSCLTLMRHANVTLQHIPPLLTSAQFRSAMTADLDDPAGLAGFWSWYDELTPALRSQVIGPVLARLRSFLLRDFVGRTMRYPHASLDMGAILDGGALLVRIPKGQLGEDTSRLLGSLLLAQVWQAATARASIAPDKRKDATLIIDECQNFLTLANSLDSMLAEARKYRLSMVLSHQDLAQFPKELLAAVSANARNKVYFTCSPEDARVLSRHTLPELDEHDLGNLGAYTTATRLVIDGQQRSAFTMRTRAPQPTVGAATAIRRAAAAAVPAQDVSAVDALVHRLSDRRGRGGGRAPRPAPDDAAG